MTHHFSIDPRSILGVSAGASMDDIQKAYREKSKKHHPDVGGDEWAFRMVVRAYEILRTTQGIEERQGMSANVAGAPDFPTGIWPGANRSHDDPTIFSGAGFSGAGQPGAVPPFDEVGSGGYKSATSPGAQAQSGSPLPTAAEFRTLDIELVWIRFELAGAMRQKGGEEPAATTLSVCMVISWPRTALVQHAPEFPDAAEKLRLVLSSFEDLRGRTQVLGSRSRIEDGQFVGWLSYPNVLQAEAGFQALQEKINAHGMHVSLHTRDEPLPMEWMDR